ncbi:MAG: alanine--tRNA ligase [Candidatus Parcubacteria bacterium]|nr:alanine--tRNA ligase [Candidatus Parcubacteria bacterium]
MTADELRKKFLEFFQNKGHKIIPGASLIPENDPTVLFTTAGMHPLVPFLLGEKHPAGNRLVSVQKCIRTGDIDEVGDDVHLTFFEMLGNWSLGDPDAPDGVGAGYWKKEAIEWSWEFLTSEKWLGFDKNKISVSVFAGDKDAPFDKESFEIWKSLGLSEEKIARLPKKDNWWGPAGQTGPCGPDTEIFFEGVEIWNDVFMEYNKNANGLYEPLKQKNVDTGMGLERTLAVLNGQKSVYETELFEPLIKENTKAARIIADHIKAAVFILAEGIEPSNIGRGYVLRRLIRRAVRYGYKSGLIDEIIKIYPELEKNRNFITEQLTREQEKFEKTLDRGLKEFEKGADPFILFSTYGFPIELTEELAKEKGVKIDLEKFNEQMRVHQELSRTASAGMFKSGLADHSEQVVKYHTASHLLLAALRRVLGENVVQKGSNITAERLRLDFSHSQKMTEEEIKKTEDLVNEKIKENIPVVCEEMSLEEAKEKGAMGMFKNKYGEKVKVYTIGDFSKEICGGPHVQNTGELGHFKITKEEASSSGIRRIKAVLNINMVKL